MRDPERYARNTVIVAAMALVVMVAINIFIVRGVIARGPDATVVGTLTDWGTLGRREKPTLRFRLQEHEPDFRVDPGVFSDTLDNDIPPGFRRGARIEVVAAAGEIQFPSRPLLRPDEPIVWVRALSVDGVPLIRLADSQEWDRKNGAAGYVLIVAGFVFLGYSYVKWTKIRSTG
jgi:hypothetical protein